MILRFLCLLSLLIAVHPQATAQPTVRFASTNYTTAPGQVVTVQVILDADTHLDGTQPLAEGLFSVACQLLYPTSSCAIAQGGVSVAGPLDYYGLVPGASLTTAPGSLATKANIALTGPSAGPYRGSPLFTVTFTNLAPVGSRYSLRLAPVEAKPNETWVLDGVGVSLDKTLLFGTAEIRVVDVVEPAPPRLSMRSLAPDTLEISYEVAPGFDHFLEASTDLTTWLDLFPVPRNDGRVLLKLDRPTRFLRLRRTVTAR